MAATWGCFLVDHPINAKSLNFNLPRPTNLHVLAAIQSNTFFFNKNNNASAALSACLQGSNVHEASMLIQTLDRSMSVSSPSASSCRLCDIFMLALHRFVGFLAPCLVLVKIISTFAVFIRAQANALQHESFAKWWKTTIQSKMQRMQHSHP